MVTNNNKELQNNNNGKSTVRTARASIVNPLNLEVVRSSNLWQHYLKEMTIAEQERIQLLQRELSCEADGSLVMRNKGEHFEFSCYSAQADKEIRLTKDDPRVYRLAKKRFCSMQLKAEKRDLERLAKASKVFANRDDAVERLLRKYSTAGLDMTRIIFTEAQNRWIDSPYTPNPYKPEWLIHPTNGGIYMRSKSEAKFGSKLEELGIPYRYDDAIHIKGEDRNNPGRIYEKTYFADFKIPNFLGGISVCEHFGALNHEGYVDNALIRLNDYDRFGTFKREEISWTLDQDIEDPVRLERAIIKMLLPY